MAISTKEKDYLDSVDQQVDRLNNKKLTKEERELILVFNEADGYWTADSSIPKYWRRLEKKGWKLENTYYYNDGTVCSKTFVSGSKKGVSILNPLSTRVMSEAQKEATRKRLAEFRNLNEEVTCDSKQPD